MKYSGIGGQAVIEGVMMRNQKKCAVAVRKPDQTIEVKEETITSFADKHPFAKLPIIRGVVSFIESLSIGTKTLNYSASFYEEEEGQAGEKDEKKEQKKEQMDDILSGVITVVAIILAIGIFLFVPMMISNLLRKVIVSTALRGLIEGVIRVIFFVAYVKMISLMDDIKRVFMYHGAEHKCISCIESGKELTVENARDSSKVHKRCGTSFLLVVMLVSILFFMFIDMKSVWLRMGLRILLIPVIAGVSYEFIRFAGSHDNAVVKILSKPGLWLQSMTTKEPTDDMLEVAIASVEAVFDWKDFIGMEEGEDAAEEDEQVEKDVPLEKDETAEEEKETEIEVLDLDEDEEMKDVLDEVFQESEG